MIYVVLFIISIIISSVSQVLLKYSANNTYESPIKEYLNPIVISAYILFFGASVITTIAYKGVPLSLGPVFETSSYVFITGLGCLVLNEKISKRKFIGIIFIVCGIIVSNINYV